MSPHEYWEDDPWLAYCYKRAHQLKNEQHNQELWLQGLYVHDAFAVVLHNAFSKKNEQGASYPKEPYPLTDAERAAREERDNRNAIKASMAQFEAWSSQLKLGKEE
jgi:hypothetical protein